jgi:hypothetical protein
MGDSAWSRVPGVARLSRWRTGHELPSPPDRRPFLTPEQFQEELEILGLSGVSFGPEDYMLALSDYLGISISVHVIQDETCPELSRQLALSGRLGEVRFSEEIGVAAIFLPSSLPPLVSDLTLLHELGHLAAGDLLVAHGGEEDRRLYSGLRRSRLAQARPFASEQLREQEANLRASYALVAGSLGAENPYVHDLYNLP